MFGKVLVLNAVILLSSLLMIAGHQLRLKVVKLATAEILSSGAAQCMCTWQGIQNIHL